MVARETYERINANFLSEIKAASCYASHAIQRTTTPPFTIS